MGSQVNSVKHLRKKIIPVLTISSSREKWKEYLLNIFYETGITLIPKPGKNIMLFHAKEAFCVVP